MECHTRVDDAIKNYLDAQRADWKTLPRAVCVELETFGVAGPLHLDHLYANNAESRIRFTRIAVQKSEEHPSLCGAEPVYFVTLTDGRFTVPLSEAANFDTRPLQAWSRQALADFSFIAMVEPAYFPHYPRRNSDMVSWHTHHLVFGTTYAKLNRALCAINESRTAFVESAPVAVCRRLTRSKAVLSKLLYMLKSPMKRYNAYRPPGFKMDPDTGELTPKRLRVQKDWLRTGERALMCRVMADRYLDRLLFGQGEGTALCRAIRAEALAPFNEYERRHQREFVTPPHMRTKPVPQI